MALFDAVIELNKQFVPPGIEPALALLKVREAIVAMPGAGRISVDWYDGLSHGAARVRVLQADGPFRLDEAACLRIAALVEAKLRPALFPALAPVER